ncbi:preprotein translocase subunit SecY [Geomonas sp. Red69]|uniref:Protein translocase subunit SecY n=2 Tax=Geomonas TaxID=2651583 RepID=A0A6V8N1E1_9BACT|nr:MULTISPECIES: preprotein translocase subunit SecY [Geomonas]MBU5638362.1 preprotein translocase subunit SecY [Geomonas diazotrophica]QWV96635.1 preprotein translocase subunit SecY [Geomonas nitrogeniifigens]QXE85738.1 preprotein translocase subunit SecY [Geomonas nitrogeniifigens]UPU36976.1 preprotein translocase subunit SecY [Geomonas paludis]GFO66221.1 protein translocase subunit SecY [Geomonas paludis]
MIEAFQNIFKIPELKKKVLFSLAMLAVYRVGCHIPTPGIDAQALAQFFKAAQGTLLGMFDMFSGGALEKLTVFALGIMPYISSSIIFQLLTVVVPAIEKLSKEGDAGRKKIIQYTRYGTVVLSVVQSFGISIGLEAMRGPAGELVVPNPGWSFRLMTVITLTAGTAFIMWLGEQMSEKGIGNGISLIIFAGIVARIPNAIGNSFRLIKTGELSLFVLLLVIAVMFLVIAAVVFMERGQRRIPIHYAKRVVGLKTVGAQSSHLPLKVNMAGVIPPIFASSIIMFPATVGNFIDVPWVQAASKQLAPGKLLYEILFVAFIVFFCYFYTAVTFNPVDVADNVKKQGGYVPGIRPGKETSDFLDAVLTKLTFAGAIYISAVCVLPSILIGKFNLPFYFGGTSLLIAVGVGMDTLAQIEAHLITRSYEGFMKGVRIQGRK